MSYNLKGKKVWVAGHSGMVGSNIAKRLKQENCDILTTTREELDLRDQSAVYSWIQNNKPDAIFLAAAKVGGIHANNTYPADFIEQNITLQQNIIHGAHLADVEKLVFLGSSCIYPKECKQPIKEEYLLTGSLEATNEWYAIAKIAGIKMCQAYRKQFDRDYISIMPTNLYGPGDNFHPQNAHVPAALLQRFHDAKEKDLEKVDVWGTGNPLREFLYVEDMADASVFLMKNYSGYDHINVGTGTEISIRDFAQKIKEVVGFEGRIEQDTSKPDGTFRKVMDVLALNKMGWHAKTSLDDGLKLYYQWFIENIDNLREH